MAQSSLKLARPWITSVRFLWTTSSLRKELATRVAATEDRDKQNASSSSQAAGEDYFSGLISNLQADNSPTLVSDNEVSGKSKTYRRPKTPQDVMNQSLRSVTQGLLEEQSVSDITVDPRVSVECDPLETFHSSKESAKEVEPIEPDTLRMTLAGPAEEKLPSRLTFASTTPLPVLSFSEILHSLNSAAEVESQQILEDNRPPIKSFPNASTLKPPQTVVKSSSAGNSGNVHDTVATTRLLQNRRSSHRIKKLRLPEHDISVVPSMDEARESPLEVKDLEIFSELGQLQDISDNSLLSPEQRSIPIDDVAPVITPSFNLASFVQRSESLQQLVKLGVDISVWESKNDVPEYILRLHFERDMKVYIRFLHDLGVHADDLGRVITKNPFLFKQTLENLRIRINYLKSKRFTKDAIVTIIVKTPIFLNVSTRSVDERLGYLQKLFALTGHEVRDVITRLPALVTTGFANIQQMQFTMLEEFGFSTAELKTIFMTKPKIWILPRYAIQERFDYLHTTIGISHKLITLFPGALTCRKFIFEQRHLYLAHLGRDQYDPTKANYVSMKALVSGSDVVFCSQVAKTPVQQFNEFLKTL